MAGDIQRGPKDSDEQHQNHETFGALTRVWRNRERRSRTWLVHELGLALPPTVVVLAAFFGTQMLTAHPILFASLASSAFLIYHEPRHRMNRLRVMIAAQFLAAAIGTGSTMIFGADYIAGAVSMVITIVLLILLNIVHPPAVSTALGFSLLGTRYGALGAFLLALAIVAALAVLQVFAIWMLHRAEARSGVGTSQ